METELLNKLSPITRETIIELEARLRELKEERMELDAMIKHFEEQGGLI